jgi:hypothetical protein
MAPPGKGDAMIIPNPVQVYFFIRPWTIFL